VSDPAWFEDGKTPAKCYQDEEHDVELYEINKRGGYDVWMCMICGLSFEKPREIRPEDIVGGAP